MRRRLRAGLLAGLVFAAASPAVAQSGGGRGAAFGVLGGATFSTLGGPDAAPFNFKNRASFAFGGFAQLGVSRNFAIEPQLLYIRKGAKASNANVTFAARIGYLEVPVLLTARFPSGKPGGVSPFFQAGPAVGFKLDCKILGTNGTISISSNCQDLDPDPALIKSTDLSLVFGAGVDFGRARVTARYELGLSKIDDSSNASDVKNRSIVVLVGWTLRTPK